MALLDLAIAAIGLGVFAALGLFVIDMNRNIRERER
jgi:hypothetical protein